MDRLETKRLIIREFDESDIGNYNINSNVKIFNLIIEKTNYAIVLKKVNKVIGAIRLNKDVENNELCKNIGISLIKEYQGCGIMSEALTTVIKNAHNITPCLSYVHTTDDLRSRHIANKFGFKFIKKITNKKGIDFLYYILELN